ncbi:MAG: aminoglycoside phosphotransferase family protein [Hyphomicrobiaceae bacterium]|nr:aminoglycoside phosphotransferase family protein [Hyphomicrobiaceae bacterium]
MQQRPLIDFAPYLRRWALQADGAPFASLAGTLMPVLHAGAPAMLKISHEPDEIFGAGAMQWWDGEGAARVLAHDGEALLMERATGSRSLVTMVRDGQDDDASRIICGVAAQLHAPRPKPLPPLKPMVHWFAALPLGAPQYGGIVARAAATLEQLLAFPRDVTQLHGDLHHENVLDGGQHRGWLAIDPKGLLGDRGYDFANIVCNPERDLDIVTSPGRLLRQAGVIAEAAGYERRRLLQWILAYAGLSAVWILDDGDTPHLEFEVADIVAAELDR